MLLSVKNRVTKSFLWIGQREEGTQHFPHNDTHPLLTGIIRLFLIWMRENVLELFYSLVCFPHAQRSSIHCLISNNKFLRPSNKWITFPYSWYGGQENPPKNGHRWRSNYSQSRKQFIDSKLIHNNLLDHLHECYSPRFFPMIPLSSIFHWHPNLCVNYSSVFFLNLLFHELILDFCLWN